MLKRRVRALDHGAEHGVLVETFQRRGGVDARAGLERGERVDLEEVDRAVVAEAQVDPPEIADAELAVDGLAELLDPLGLAALHLGRRADRDVPVELGLELVVVDRVAARRRRRLVDEVLDRLQDAVALRRGRLEERHRHVAPDDELLDEEPGRIADEGLAHDLVQAQRVLDHRVLRDALRAPLEVRLHDDREPQRVRLELARILEELPARRRDPVLGEHELRELLVERERERVGVGAGVRHAELVEERREERLPEPPAPPLGGVEDEVRPVGLEARDGARGRPGDLDPLHAMAEPLDGAGEGVDGLPGVELGLLLGVREAEVVRERDAHRRRLLGPRVSRVAGSLRPRCAWPPASRRRASRSRRDPAGRAWRRDRA